MPVDTVPPPLSHSSASILMECEQRYSYYKVERVPTDKDYSKPGSLAVGSAFHFILERSRHLKPKSITEDLAHCVANPEIGLSEEDAPLVHAMVLKYLRLHAKMPLKVLAVEIEVKTDWFHGFIDAVMDDGVGGWWIVDLKSYKSIHMPSLSALPKDPQLNLYAGHFQTVADMLKIDPAGFSGVRWRVVTKSTAKQKKDETLAQYVARLADKHIVAYDIPVPVESLAWAERMIMHKSLWQKSGRLIGGSPFKNYKNCMAFYSPCPYWSRCHGKPFSDMQNDLKITVED